MVVNSQRRIFCVDASRALSGLKMVVDPEFPGRCPGLESWSAFGAANRTPLAAKTLRERAGARFCKHITVAWAQGDQREFEDLADRQGGRGHTGAGFAEPMPTEGKGKGW